MARMFGFIGNRADLGARVLELNAEVLTVRRAPEEPALGWGIGFYQSGEVLLRRRPIDERASISLAEAAESVRTDVLIGHVRRPGIGSLRTENTHPFRYGTWLFAQTGTVAGFAQLQKRMWDSIPEFLRRNVRGESDSELFFYLVLSFLYDAGHLSDGQESPESVVSALRASIALVDRLSAEEGFERNTGSILMSNGEHLIAANRDAHAGYRVLKGRYDVEELLGEEGVRKTRLPSIDSTHFTLVAFDMDDIPQRWAPLEGRQIITLTRSEEPVCEPL